MNKIRTTGFLVLLVISVLTSYLTGSILNEEGVLDNPIDSLRGEEGYNRATNEATNEPETISPLTTNNISTVTNQPKMATTTTPEWQEGMTIRTDSYYPDSMPEKIYGHVPVAFNTSGDFSDIIESDDIYYFSDTRTSKTVDMSDVGTGTWYIGAQVFVIPAKNSGTLKFEGRTEEDTDAGSSLFAPFWGSDGSLSATITNDYISNDRILGFSCGLIQVYYYSNWQEKAYYGMGAYDFKNERWDVLDQTIGEQAGRGQDEPNMTMIRVWTDTLYFEPDSEESYSRVEYRYSGDTLEYLLEIRNTLYNAEINVTLPTFFDFEYIYPSCTVSVDDNILTMTDTAPITYEIHCIDGSPKQYLPNYDTSALYFTDIGFEGDWDNDWEHTTPYEWDADLISEIAFDGTFALNLTSPSVIITYTSLDSYVYPAEYIFTFAYYRTTTSPIYFYWWENDAWQYEELKNDTNRWIKHIGRYNITGHTGGYNIAFVTSSVDQHIIIDEFRSWEANGQVRTTGYANNLMETGMFATMRSIDLYNNPAVPYHPVTVYLRDRTVDATIFTYNTYTDVVGRIHVAFTLPYSYQMKEMEYAFRVASQITGNYTDSYFTPIQVEFYDCLMVENYTNYGLGGIDFTENWDDGATYGSCDNYQTNGYNRINPSSTVASFRIYFSNINGINASYYNQLRIVLRTNVSDLIITPNDQQSNVIGSAENLPQSTGELDWYKITWNLTADSDWTGTENGFYFYFDEDGGDGQPESNNFVWIDQIRLYHVDETLLVETATYGYLTTEYNQFVYYVVVDSVPQEYIFDLDPFLFDLSVGSHQINITPFLDLSRRWLCYIYGDQLTITYDVAESGTMKITYHDQSGFIIHFDSFKTYIDDVRLYEQYVYFLNTSMVFNLTVTDLFDNIVYQNLTCSFEFFKEIQITLYSIKIQNQQEFPIWIQLKRGEKTFSEAIFPFEIVEYKLEADTYDVRVNYTTVNANKEVVYNGTYVTYQYTVTKDTAIFITGTSIQDVFNNVVQVAQDIDNVNATLSSQIIDVDIHISNVNTSITDQVVSVEIFLDNVNTTVGSQLVDISNQITNLDANISIQFTDINNSILNINSTIFNQTVDILSDLDNVNSTIYSQTLTILSDISNTNSTLYSQTVTILNDISNMNSTLYSQSVTILSDIQNTNSTLYTQTVSILSDLSNVNSTVYGQTVTILSDIYNVNSTLFDQTVTMLSKIENVNSTIFYQTVTILSNITNMNSTIYTQTLSILSNIQNTNSTLHSQTVSILSDISNMNSTIYSQTISILSDIQNTNSTIYAQTIEILSDIQNTNSTIFNQTIEIISKIVNTNTTLFNQNLQILSELHSVNSTIYNATLEIITIIGEMYGIFRIYFSIIDSFGIGLPWETVLLKINNSRQFDQNFYVSNNTFLTTAAYDWFGIKHWEDNFTITTKTEINITMTLYLVILTNNGNYTAYVELYRAGRLGLNVTVSPGNSIGVRMTEGVYSYKVYYFKAEHQNVTTRADEASEITDWGKSLHTVGQFRVSAKLPAVLDVSTPTITPPPLEGLAKFWNAFISGFTLAAVGSAIASFIVFMFLKESWYGTKAVGLGKAHDDSLIKPQSLEKYEDQLQTQYYRNPEQYQKKHDWLQKIKRAIGFK